MLDRHLQGDRAPIAESKNIGMIYMEILEQRTRVICGLFEAERTVCNVRGVAVSLLLKRDHLPVSREFRQPMAERGLYRVLRRDEAAQEADASDSRFHESRNKF
jgi:hypothetical protein